MKVGDWVETPNGIGILSSFSNSYIKDKMNAFVWINRDMYAFAIHLVTPVAKPVADILTAVNTNERQ